MCPMEGEEERGMEREGTASVCVCVCGRQEAAMTGGRRGGGGKMKLRGVEGFTGGGRSRRREKEDRIK